MYGHIFRTFVGKTTRSGKSTRSGIIDVHVSEEYDTHRRDPEKVAAISARSGKFIYLHVPEHFCDDCITGADDVLVCAAMNKGRHWFSFREANVMSMPDLITTIGPT